MDPATAFRQSEIEKIRVALEDFQNHYSKTSDKFKRWHTRFQTVCAFTVGASTILKGSGLAASLRAIGIPIGAPLIVVGTALSLVSTSRGLTVKFFSRKAEKHKKIMALLDETLSVIKSLTSAVLNDEKISDEECKEIFKKYDSFSSRKLKIRYSSHTDGQKSKSSKPS